MIRAGDVILIVIDVSCASRRNASAFGRTPPFGQNDLNTKPITAGRVQVTEIMRGPRHSHADSVSTCPSVRIRTDSRFAVSVAPTILTIGFLRKQARKGSSGSLFPGSPA